MFFNMKEATLNITNGVIVTFEVTHQLTRKHNRDEHLRDQHRLVFTIYEEEERSWSLRTFRPVGLTSHSVV